MADTLDSKSSAARRVGSTPTEATMTIIRKIRNKERCGLRGPKQRSTVFRAEQNQYWERIYKDMAETLCRDHRLNLQDFLSTEPRNTWEHTYDNIREQGYRHWSKSIAQHMYEEERATELQRAEEARLWMPIMSETVLSCHTIKGGTTSTIICLGKTYEVVEWVEHKHGRDPVIVCDDGEARLMNRCLFHD
jgi:hypothetical protein